MHSVARKLNEKSIIQFLLPALVKLLSCPGPYIHSYLDTASQGQGLMDFGSGHPVHHKASLNLSWNFHFYRLPWSLSWFLNSLASLHCRLCISLTNDFFELLSWLLHMADLITLLDPCHPSHLNLLHQAWILRNPHKLPQNYPPSSLLLLPNVQRYLCPKRLCSKNSLILFYLNYFKFIFCDF